MKQKYRIPTYKLKQERSFRVAFRVVLKNMHSLTDVEELKLKNNYYNVKLSLRIQDLKNIFLNVQITKDTVVSKGTATVNLDAPNMLKFI